MGIFVCALFSFVYRLTLLVRGEEGVGVQEAEGVQRDEDGEKGSFSPFAVYTSDSFSPVWWLIVEKGRGGEVPVSLDSSHTSCC